MSQSYNLGNFESGESLEYNLMTTNAYEQYYIDSYPVSIIPRDNVRI